MVNINKMSFLEPVGGFIDDIGGGIGGAIDSANPFAVFQGIGDFFKAIVELAILLAKNIGPMFEFVFFIINNTIDVVYGTIALLNGLGKEFVELMPHLNKIMDLLLEAIDFLIDFYKENSKLLVVSVMLIPAYGMIYLLIRQLNILF